jgi:uncharacterized protein (TIGR00290 family)
MDSIKSKPFFSSWSGGKDSCLALYRAIKAGGVPEYLLTMMTEDGERSRSHGLKLSLLQSQAEAIGIPLVVKNASWDEYEEVFLSTIKDFGERGITNGVFGDIDLEDHIRWVDRVCSSAKIKPFEPLWKQERKILLDEFISLGFKAIIISVKESLLGKNFLGKEIDEGIIRELEESGVDASGEEGEYHTLVIDGPIFSSSIAPGDKGIISINGYSFLDVFAERLRRK